MTKAELVERVAEMTGFTKTETAVICEGFLTAIKDVMAEGSNIEIRRFGTFKLKTRKPRIARNPRTGDAVPIEERLIPVFKPSKAFKVLIPQD
ncbi:MAG TPA: integration host factor subunit beta [candidate division Zixibacteria bacterium]|nr:integration host factor subunit beta [candidate division Zixibacteria bacterium]